MRLLCHGHTDGRGKVIAHRRRAGVRDQSLPLLQFRRLVRNDTCRRVATDDSIVRPKHFKESIDKVVGFSGGPGTLWLACTTGYFALPLMRTSSHFAFFVLEGGFDVQLPRHFRKNSLRSQWIGISGDAAVSQFRQDPRPPGFSSQTVRTNPSCNLFDVCSGEIPVPAAHRSSAR